MAAGGGRGCRRAQRPGHRKVGQRRRGVQHYLHKQQRHVGAGLAQHGGVGEEHTGVRARVHVHVIVPHAHHGDHLEAGAHGQQPLVDEAVATDGDVLGHSEVSEVRLQLLVGGPGVIVRRVPAGGDGPDDSAGTGRCGSRAQQRERGTEL